MVYTDFYTDKYYTTIIFSLFYTLITYSPVNNYPVFSFE